jgi:hypothetical protein
MPHKRAKRSVREEQQSQKCVLINVFPTNETFLCQHRFDLHYRGTDYAPSSNQTSKRAISSEGIPKSVARVLNAAHVRQEWREKKRKLESGEDAGECDGKGKKRRVDRSGDAKEKGAGKAMAQHDSKTKNKSLGIQPGESLGHFNRRVF